VFLHHGLGSVSLWRDFPRQLCAATELPGLLYDRQNHGRSAPATEMPGVDRHQKEALLLTGLLQQHQVRDYILIGHSDGGTIALLCAALPDIIPPRGIISEAAHVFVEDITRAGIRATVDGYRTGLRERLLRHHGPKTDSLFWNWAGGWLSPTFDAWNICDQLGAVRCPVYAMQGAEDEYGTTAQLDAIAAGVSGTVATEIIPACAHEPHQQAPSATLSAMQRAIRSFLNR
jgi:pimeloyl-ACP methyl ester carboxylesterase